MKNKIELGPIQKAWIKSLREHPERQKPTLLGSGNIKDYKACCLGEALICYNRAKKKKLPFKDGCIVSHFEGINSKRAILNYSKLGLNGDLGEFSKNITYKGNYYRSLADLNDRHVTWPEIASIIEKHKDKLFTKSV